MARNRILVVDDEKLISWSLRTMLEKFNYQVETAATGAEAINLLATFRPNLMMLDVWLPDFNGLDLLKQFKASDEDLLVIMMTGDANADSAVNALKSGAEDYIGKPFNVDLVRHVIEQALEKKRLKVEVDLFRKGVRRNTAHDKLVGNCPKMIDVFKMIKVCADNDAKTILILGESGTGKELVARAVHSHSARADAPFIEVNCAAIPENLLENELFGHERGAYTDASRKQKGIFELADGGTVFLDEIGDMPISMQAKVLKIIETKRFRRLGGEEDVEAEVRIIAATHQDLSKMVAEKNFRGDLFYRLNVMNIRVPSLRERLDDIPHLAQYFIARLNEEYGRNVEGISPEALRYLKDYDWPGNIRELRNTIERAMMLETGTTINLSSLNADSRQRKQGPILLKGLFTGQAPRSFSLDQISFPPDGISMEEVEILLIKQALAKAEGNQTKAAKFLKMSRDTLRYRMKKFGLGNFSKKCEWSSEGEGKQAEVTELRPSNLHSIRKPIPKESA